MAVQNLFRPAGLVQKKAKILVYGEPGSGKTVFAIGKPGVLPGWPHVALIDTEGGADLYGGSVPFDILRTKSFGDILDAVEVVKADHGRTWHTLVIDPISVVWQVLQDAGQQAAEARAQRYGRAAEDVLLTQRDWGLIKRRLYSAMTELVNLPVNVILTAHLRDVMETRRDGRGQEVAVKIGEKPDAEKKTGYWPDVIIKLSVVKGEHVGTIEKDRSGLFRVGQQVPNISYAHFAPLLEQHAQGEVVTQQQEEVAAQRDTAVVDEGLAPAHPNLIEAIQDLRVRLAISDERLAETLERDYQRITLDELNQTQANHLLSRLNKADKAARGRAKAA